MCKSALVAGAFGDNEFAAFSCFLAPARELCHVFLSDLIDTFAFKKIGRLAGLEC